LSNPARVVPKKRALARISGFARVGSRVAMTEIMLTLLFILLVVALIGGGIGHSRFGYAGWSPAGILIVVLLVLFLTGNRL